MDGLFCRFGQKFARISPFLVAMIGKGSANDGFNR
jgi:hypothetical protein